tara:strand:- start:7108 stop:8532 length:1425 start_codon:yes stop_codon:yes gene_type:complete
MAADQTIIQAMGQRFAPVKVDYKPYFNGLTTVSTALINMQKRIRKLDKSLVTKQMKTEVKGQNENFAKLRRFSVNDPQFQAVFEDYLQTASNNKNKLEAVVKNLEQQLDGASLSVNMADEMYYGTILENGINFSRVLAVGDKNLNDLLNDGTLSTREKKDFIMENGIRDMIVSPDGTFVDAGNLNPKLTQKKDSEKLYDHITQVTQKLIPIKQATSANQDPMNTWNETKNVSIAYIEDMINENSDVLPSAMADRKYNFAGGKRKSFIDHVFNQNQELSKQFEEWVNKDPDGPGPELSPIEKDPNSKEIQRMKISMVMEQHNSQGGDLTNEFLDFIESAYDSYKDTESEDKEEDKEDAPPKTIEGKVEKAIADAKSKDDQKIINQLNKINKDNNLNFTFENPSRFRNSIKVTKNIDGKTYTQTFRTKDKNFTNDIKSFMKDPVAYTLINQTQEETNTQQKREFDFNKTNQYNQNR